MLDVALMYLNIPKASRGKNHPNPLSCSSPTLDLRGLLTFVYASDTDDVLSEGRGRRCRVDRAMDGRETACANDPESKECIRLCTPWKLVGDSFLADKDILCTSFLFSGNYNLKPIN